MTDSTTARDLAKKIEWVGLRNLSPRERRRAHEELEEVCRYLPRLLALGLWSYFGEEAPADLVTRSAAGSLESFEERQEAKRLFESLLASYSEEEESSELGR